MTLLTVAMSRRFKLVWRGLWPLGFYLAVALMMTLPLPLQLTTHIPGLEGDAYMHLWTFDWIDRTIRSEAFSFHTTDLFYPYGVSLLSQNIAWINIALWMLFRLVLDAVPAYSLSVLLIPFFNGYALFLLAQDVTTEAAQADRAALRTSSIPGVNWAALLSGVVGLAWPAITSQLNHPNLALVGFLALAMRHLLRLIRDGRKRDLWWAGLFLGVMGLVRVQVLLLSAFLVGPMTLYQMIARGQTGNAARWRQLLLSGLIGLLLSAGVAAPLALHYVTGGHYDELIVAQPGEASQDVVFYVLPNTRHPLWGEPVRRLASEVLDLEPPFYVAALGYNVVFLSGVALIWGTGQSQEDAPVERRVLPWGWGATALVPLLLALGPLPRVAGHTLTLKPYAWLYEGVLLPIVREPRRFVVLLSVPLGVLAGLGVQRLTYRLPPGRRRTASWGAIAIICLELTVYPCPGQSVATPVWFERLGQEPGRFGVLEVPMYRQQDESYMLYQLTHRKPLVHGHVSRPPEAAYAFIDRVPLLAHLQHRISSVPPEPPFGVSQQMELLHRANIRYLILHPLFLTPDQLAAWREWLVVPPHYDDGDLVVYETSPSIWASFFTDAPELFAGLKLARTAISPTATIPGGWVSVQVHWFVAKEALGAPNSGCLIWRGSDGRDEITSCDLEIYGGDGERIVTPGLVQSAYVIQVPSSLDAGLYTLVASQTSDGVSTSGAGAIVSTGATVSLTDSRRGMTPPSPEQPVDVVFGDQIALVGYDFVPDAPEGAQLDLFWHARRRPSASYKVFVHVIDIQRGQVVMQQDFVPLDWVYPTDAWLPGEYVQDRVILDLPSLPPGGYQLMVGLYHPETGERLTTAPAYPSDAVPLTVELEGTPPDAGVE